MTKMALLISVIVASFAFAADTKPGPNVQYSKTTTYNFEDDTIEGDLTRPDGEYVDAVKRVNHTNLIRIREEFKEKVMQSVGEL